MLSKNKKKYIQVAFGSYVPLLFFSLVLRQCHRHYVLRAMSMEMEIATWRDYEGINVDSHWQLKASVIWTFEPLSTCLQYSAMLAPQDEWTDLQGHSPAMFEGVGASTVTTGACVGGMEGGGRGGMSEGRRGCGESDGCGGGWLSNDWGLSEAAGGDVTARLLSACFLSTTSILARSSNLSAI